LPKLSFLPKDRRFSILFEQSASNVVKMAAEFKELVNTWKNPKQRVDILADMEHDGDAITHDIMALLHRTFITPFDREDISALARSLDDVADRIHSTADTMFLYGISAPSPGACEISDLIAEAASEVAKAVTEISGRIDRTHLLQHCVEINRIENLGDNLYRTALADLFAGSTDVFNVIKWREIYEYMESTIDGTEIVADVLEGMALKYA
jgi:uncharacterized protein